MTIAFLFGILSILASFMIPVDFKPAGVTDKPISDGSEFSLTLDWPWESHKALKELRNSPDWNHVTDMAVNFTSSFWIAVAVGLGAGMFIMSLIVLIISHNMAMREARKNHTKVSAEPETRDEPELDDLDPTYDSPYDSPPPSYNHTLTMGRNRDRSRYDSTERADSLATSIPTTLVVHLENRHGRRRE